ncbi:glucoamylase family protein [Cecembia calidifontis]|uniref:Glycoamylase-like domain-containing protein n=1 Tax=Cecembia calidifontis TaxID=1187080 RepID=A0A4Q7PAG2_9BACT|nr:glucoamylase family protein [Cecembia calidifontis]RZS96937.1 hypothetical protein BC751_2533 [Cecembia calidifontis]
MKQLALLFVLIFFLVGCGERGEDVPAFTLLKVEMGTEAINLDPPYSEGLPLDRPITMYFSRPVDEGVLNQGIILSRLNGNPVNVNFATSSDNTNVILRPIGALEAGETYLLSISDLLRSESGQTILSRQIQFKTQEEGLRIESIQFEGGRLVNSNRVIDVNVDLNIEINFSAAIDRSSAQNAFRINGQSIPGIQVELSNEDKRVILKSTSKLPNYSKFELEIDNSLKSASGASFSEEKRVFFTGPDGVLKFPLISDDALLTKIQEQTFKYFWDFAHPASGMARERNTSGNLVTVGGSGFGVMAIIVGIERGFISRSEGVQRLALIVDFLSKADRFHGVWPHWLDGNTGKTIPFSQKDNGGDLVETAFMIQGLLTVKEFLQPSIPTEKVIIDHIQQLWEEVEWSWYTRGSQNVLYWHWSPDFGWDMNLPIQGYNESLIVYVLAASSPTFPISKEVYDQGWARNGQMRNGNSFYQFNLPLGEDFGGPLFFSHYSFLGLDPRNLKDAYADYWEQGKMHTKINRAHAINNPKGFAGYGENSWGFTASDNHQGYSAHSPINDLGVISLTAALSSFPYTPEESMEALRFFYFEMGDRLWGPYGFYDAFNVTESWYANSYLAIDQGPIILMIENHRSGLLWSLFMRNPEVLSGLRNLNFTY